MTRQSPARTRRRFLALLTALTCSCSHSAPKAQAPANDPLSASDEQVAAEVAEGEPTAMQSLDWTIALIEKGGELSADDYAQLFSAEFKQNVPIEVAVGTFKKFAAELPPIAVKSRTDTPPTAAVAVLETADGPQRLDVIMTTDVPRKINGLMLQPIYEPPKDYEEARKQLERSGAQHSLLVAEVVKNQCVPKQAFGADAQLAVGSTFKLWVLLALDTKLRGTGKKGWEHKLVIKDQLKSFLGGETFELTPGSEISIRQAALNMIAQSDNTAADHLIDYIGRENVERAQRETKHARPDVNIPWLTTRELFALKLDNDDQEIARFRGATVADKRKQLTALASRPLDSRKAEAWTSPRSIDIEWHASAIDICNALATLGARGRFDPQSEVLKAMSEDTGLSFDPEYFKYLGYKGGSEPGVLNMSWLVQRNDGRWFVVVLSVNDPRRVVKEMTVLSTGEGVMRLVHDAD
ncbi:MAG: serine hydrolase [Polyangiales bacterium]